MLLTLCILVAACGGPPVSPTVLAPTNSTTANIGSTVEAAVAATLAAVVPTQTKVLATTPPASTTLSSPPLTPAKPPTLVGDSAEHEATGFDIYFIDVGQGDATLIVADDGQTLLVDGGRSKTRIRDRLDSLGIDDLDAIAMTHPDADHIAGLVEVLELFPIERVYLNGGHSGTITFGNFMDAIANEHAEVITVSRGDSISLGSLTIDVLHPGILSGDTNVDSMVLQVSCGAVEVLLTGDAELPSEQEMISFGVLSEVDVLKVGHHGSRSSTGQGFLNIVKPEIGVISCWQPAKVGHIC